MKKWIFGFMAAWAVSVLVCCDDSTSAQESSAESPEKLDTVYVHDTLHITDTLESVKTIEVNKYDSIDVHDTISEIIRDTVSETVYDTVNNTVYDTVSNVVYDTIRTTDTIRVSESTGDSCSVTTLEDGSVSVNCNGNLQTLYQALCDGIAYDPTTQACVADSVVDMCGTRTYDKDKQICDKGIIFDILRDSRDQKAYRTVTIGKQTWMAENLNYSVRKSACGGGSTDLPNGDCDTYGRVYQWTTALMIDSLYDSAYANISTPHQGICPAGWHLPNNEDWQTLYETVMENRSTVDFDVQMRSDSLWIFTQCPLIDCKFTDVGQNLVGMNILPTGRLWTDMAYREALMLTYFISVDDANTETHASYMAFFSYLMNGYPYIIANKNSGMSKKSYFSVRCLKNAE